MKVTVVAVFLLTALGAAQAELERYKIDEIERAALLEKVSTALDGMNQPLQLHRIRGRIDGPTITAHLDFLPYESNEDTAAYRAVECSKRGYQGTWTCANLTLRHEIISDGDVLRLGPSIEVAEGFELARTVHVLHLTDHEKLRTDAAMNGLVGRSELLDIVAIEGDGQRYEVSLAGQPIEHHVLIIERVRCGGFATCGVELTGIERRRYLELPRDFPPRPPPAPALDIDAL